jgi:beta-phosphoglucomutase-like phosphatase (HAD superfamily)
MSQPASPIKAILFDLEGTIIDTEPAIASPTTTTK